MGTRQANGPMEPNKKGNNMSKHERLEEEIRRLEFEAEVLKDCVCNLFELNNGEYSLSDMDGALEYWRQYFETCGIGDAIHREESQPWRKKKEQIELIQGDEYNKYWTCSECGKDTSKVDYDYLLSHDLHLECALEKEVKLDEKWSEK